MDTLPITNMQVFPVREPKGKLRAYARVLLAEQLQLTGLKLYNGDNGLFVSYPNDPAHKGEDYRQLFYPVDLNLRDSIEKAIIQEYYTTMYPELLSLPLEEVLARVNRETDKVVKTILEKRLGGTL